MRAAADGLCRLLVGSLVAVTMLERRGRLRNALLGNGSLLHKGSLLCLPHT